MSGARNSHLTRFCVTGLMLITFAGCFERQQTVFTEYGKIRGKSAGTSVNGVSVLADILREQGHSVSRYGRLSPKIERYETLIWFPADRNCPSDEAVNRLETWLNNGYRRTLIYVGYDFAGEIDYYRNLVERTQGEQKERAMRALAEAQLQEDARQYDDLSTDWNVNFVGGKPSDDRCRWFNLEIDKRKQSTDLDGRLAESLGTGSPPSIQTRAWLVPRESYPDSYPDRELETLLTVDDRPFAFRYLEKPDNPDDYWSSKNQLIFVTNAQFMANYGLVETGNRRLAESLIEQIEPNSEVLFLESGDRGIEVSDSDYDAHNHWSWITRKPLCYMVPHFLAWGVLFCFAFYPIFGRPKRTTSNRNRTFGDHIVATARLSGRHESLSSARSKVRDFMETGERPSNKQTKVPKSTKDNSSQ